MPPSDDFSIMLVPKSPLLQPSDPEALLNTKNRNQPSPPLSLPSSKALTSSPTQCSPPLCSAPPPAAPRCSAPPPSDPRPSLPARPLLSLALSASLLPDGLSTPRRPLRSSLPDSRRSLTPSRTFSSSSATSTTPSPTISSPRPPSSPPPSRPPGESTTLLLLSAFSKASRPRSRTRTSTSSTSTS